MPNSPETRVTSGEIPVKKKRRSPRWENGALIGLQALMAG
jgi:hypothetical protein